MKTLTIPLPALAVCSSIALGTMLVKDRLWHLGTVYWIVLASLALVHVAITVAVVAANPRRLPVRLGAGALLLVGQWWAVQLLAMQIVWGLRGFAP